MIVLRIAYALCLLSLPTGQESSPSTSSAHRQTTKAIYIPLADHCAGIVAYEEYRDEMKSADTRFATEIPDADVPTPRAL